MPRVVERLIQTLKSMQCSMMAQANLRADSPLYVEAISTAVYLYNIFPPVYLFNDFVADAFSGSEMTVFTVAPELLDTLFKHYFSSSSVSSSKHNTRSGEGRVSPTLCGLSWG